MPDVELDLSLQLIASIEGLTEEMRKQHQREQRKAQAIRVIPLAPPQATAAPFTIDTPDLLMAKTGYYWDVRRLSLSGWSAGSVTVYRNASGGEPVALFATPGILVYGKAHLVLHPGEKLVAVGTGITGFVQLNGDVVAIESWLFPSYLL